MAPTVEEGQLFGNYQVVRLIEQGGFGKVYLVENPVTHRRHELTSMGIRVNAETLRQQLALTGQLDWLKLPYHRGIVDGTLPLTIGGGIGQSRTQMLLLKKAHLGEVSVSVWPQILKDLGHARDIHVLE